MDTITQNDIENIYEIFIKKLKLYEFKDAVIFNDIRYTYKQISDLIDNVANVITLNITDSCNIGLLVERSVYMIVAEMAVIKCGCTFVPIDITLPEERINYMLENSNVNLILTYHYDARNIKIDITNINLLTARDTKWKVEKQHIQSSYAYILYTSGSTGLPKGVIIGNRALSNFVTGLDKAIDSQKTTRILGLTSSSFDISILELLVSLCYGWTIVLASDKEYKNPRLLKNLILNYNIDTVQITPSTISELLYDGDDRFLFTVKTLLLGGENLQLELLHQVQARNVDRIFNMYGPTEATIWSSVSNLTNKDVIDIGLPINNVEYLIKDTNGNNSDQGELWITGKCLADGYINMKEITEEKFSYISNDMSYRVYKTGDIVQKNKNGEIIYLCRNDNQVKINGHRIELNEIEKQIINVLHNSSVYVMPYKQALLAVIKASEAIDYDEIILHLEKVLPDYMIPGKYYAVSELPYTISGKINREKLLENVIQQEELTANEAEEDEEDEEDEVAEKIFKILSQATVSAINSKLIDVPLKYAGMNSLTFIKSLTNIENEFIFEFEDEMLDFNILNTPGKIIDYVKERYEKEDFRN